MIFSVTSAGLDTRRQTSEPVAIGGRDTTGGMMADGHAIEPVGTVKPTRKLEKKNRV